MRRLFRNNFVNNRVGVEFIVELLRIIGQFLKNNRYIFGGNSQKNNGSKLGNKRLIPTPQSSPQRSAGGNSQLHSKRSSNGPSPENFLTIGGYFERNTYRVTALRWLKKKILSFDRFRLATLEQFLYTSTATVEWNSLYELF